MSMAIHEGKMALLQLLCEETIHEESLDHYFENLYRVVCVSERAVENNLGSLVRTTYIVDWEQLVHVLEDYAGFGEDIVEVSQVSGDEARRMRQTLPGTTTLALA
jgi:hypothetical protein